MLKPSGRMAFFVIHSRPGLPAADRARVAARDNAFVATDVPYRELLEQAGFVEVDEEDATPGYRAAAARWLAEAQEMEADLRAAMGDEVFEDKQRRRRDRLDDIDEGLVGRAMLIAQNPG